MGWWTANENGGIDMTAYPTQQFATGSPGGMLNVHRGAEAPVWGDRPADILGEALQEIVKVFERDMGRRPTMDELQRGLRFSYHEEE